MDACPFCDPARIPGRVETLVGFGIECMVFEPLNPVVPGHLLVVPTRHVSDAAADPVVTGGTMMVAAAVVNGRGELASRYDYSSANIITSIGVPATQSVMHLHVHVVPRADGDGLPLPWTDQARAETLERQVEQHKSALNVALAYAGGFRAPESREDELTGCQAVLDTETGEVLT